MARFKIIKGICTEEKPEQTVVFETDNQEQAWERWDKGARAPLDMEDDNGDFGYLLDTEINPSDATGVWWTDAEPSTEAVRGPSPVRVDMIRTDFAPKGWAIVYDYYL